MHYTFGILFGLVTLFLWGIADYYAALLNRAKGVRSTLLRVQFAGLIIALLFGIGLYRTAFNPVLPLNILLHCSWISVIFAASYLVFYKGLAEGLVAVVSPISACWSLITVLWSCFVWKEILKGHAYFGIVFIIIGVLLTSLEVKNIFRLNRTQLAKGAIEGVLAMLFWGLSLTLIIPIVRDYGWYYPILWLRFGSFIVTAIFFILFPAYLHKPAAGSLKWPPFIFVAFCDISGVFSFSEGSRLSLASVVAPIASCFPVVTIIMAVYLLKEHLTRSQKIGIGLSLTGIILLSI